ncbi:MAG: acyltransferase, partial [Candidatus Latescibacteria bacterium]|nr:acyltransferase [Candidatus Latescibacterota bacterium]
MKNIRVASVQFEHSPGNKQTNFSKIRNFIQKAAKQNVEMIVFPECCITGYWFLRGLTKQELTGLAEPVFEGPSSQELLQLAKTNNMTVGAGLVEIAEKGKLYNTYVVALPDGTLHRHRKIHCFISEHMSSGSEYTVFDTPHGCRAGVLICYDNNIGENVRITALSGAEILMAPHQTGGCKTSSPFAMGLVDKKLWENRHNNPQAIEEEFKGEKGRGWLMRWLPARAHDNG